MSKATPAQRKKANSDRLWLIGGPIVLVLLLLLTAGPQILNALLPRNVINARNLPSDVDLKITFTLSVDDLDKNYFSFDCAMEMGIRENSTRRFDYNIRVKPEPVFAGSHATGVSVPFENLKDQGEYVRSSQYSNGSWTSERFEQYTYDDNLSSAYVLRANARFPGSIDHPFDFLLQSDPVRRNSLAHARSWNRLLCNEFVVTRQIRLTKFLPKYVRTTEKSLSWGALFRTSVL